jgi:two-component system, chemotaxis family, chemotaxis protein CheY
VSLQSPSEMCVLVVEDQVPMRKIIKTVLISIGVKMILEAADGVEGLSLLKQLNKGGLGKATLRASNIGAAAKPVDFIICDWRMPRLNGIELLQVIREDKDLHNLPFIMLTAEDVKDRIITAIELGVTDYVVKPFTPAILEAKLLSVMTRKG